MTKREGGREGIPPHGERKGETERQRKGGRKTERKQIHREEERKEEIEKVGKTLTQGCKGASWAMR